MQPPNVFLVRDGRLCHDPGITPMTAAATLTACRPRRTHAGLLLLALAAVAIAGELSIPNRAPEPGEVGYRPADGSAARLNPPSLV